MKSWTEEGDEQGGVLQLSSFICKKKRSWHRSLGLVKNLQPGTSLELGPHSTPSCMGPYSNKAHTALCKPYRK